MPVYATKFFWMVPLNNHNKHHIWLGGKTYGPFRYSGMGKNKDRIHAVLSLICICFLVNFF